MTKIMVVDDNRETSTFIAQVLNLEGYETIVVNNSSQALKIAETTLPQAFVLDLMMPQPDGFKLCRILRAHPKFKQAPILIVTALSDTDSRIVAIGAGANDYLVKPFNFEDLIKKIKVRLDEQPQTVETPGEKEVRTLYLRLLEAWNRRNAAGFAALFAEDGNQVGFDGSQVNGRAAIELHLSQIFADHETARYVGKVREVRFLTPDVAILQAVAGMVSPGKTDLNPALNSIQSLVLVKRGSQWCIALLQNTPAQFHGRPEAIKELTDELRKLF
jgi:uncharacterized protein (TIGR02246 family)